jgi:hypothetical protein
MNLSKPIRKTDRTNLRLLVSYVQTRSHRLRLRCHHWRSSTLGDSRSQSHSLGFSAHDATLWADYSRGEDAAEALRVVCRGVLRGACTAASLCRDC